MLVNSLRAICSFTESFPEQSSCCRNEQVCQGVKCIALWAVQRTGYMCYIKTYLWLFYHLKLFYHHFIVMLWTRKVNIYLLLNYSSPVRKNLSSTFDEFFYFNIIWLVLICVHIWLWLAGLGFSIPNQCRWTCITSLLSFCLVSGVVHGDCVDLEKRKTANKSTFIFTQMSRCQLGQHRSRSGCCVDSMDKAVLSSGSHDSHHNLNYCLSTLLFEHWFTHVCNHTLINCFRKV